MSFFFFHLRKFDKTRRPSGKGTTWRSVLTNIGVSHTCVLLLFVAYFFMESMTAAVDWENSTITLRGGMRGASRGRARQRAELRREREDRDAEKNQKYLRVKKIVFICRTYQGTSPTTSGRWPGGMR